MHRPKKKSRSSPRKPVDWLEYINDCLPGLLVIPVGPRFQADVPEWTGPPDKAHLSEDSDTLKWLGTRYWPLQANRAPTQGTNLSKGRLDSCSCSSPGSPQCVKKHISEARMRLQLELGPVYRSWKFHEMGEDVGKSWTSAQKTKFEYLVKSNPLSEGKSFLKPAEMSFPSKTRKDIVSYYLNVHVPKRISMLTRSGCGMLDSDDDEIEEAAPNAKNSLKRAQSNHVDITQLAKSHYLTGRR